MACSCWGERGSEVISSKLCHRVEADRLAQPVVVGNAEIAPALDVDRGEVEPAARRVEQERADVLDDLGVEFLRGLGRSAAQDAFDAVVVDEAGREKGLLQRQRALAVAVLGDQLEVARRAGCGPAGRRRSRTRPRPAGSPSGRSPHSRRARLAEQDGQELVVGDGLDPASIRARAASNSSSSVSEGSRAASSSTHAVVFAREERVHGHQRHVLGGAAVAGEHVGALELQQGDPRSSSSLPPSARMAPASASLEP